MSSSANQKLTISIVIVNYHSWDKLKACLTSLNEIELNQYTLDIVVVDNDPQDKRFADFAGQFPAVKFIKNTDNYGFSSGCNLGAEHATGEYLLFLNPDTEVKMDIFSPLINAITPMPPFSILATHKQDTKGKYERVARFLPRWYIYTGLGRSIHRMLIKKQIQQNFAPNKAMVYPEWVSGSVMFMRKHDFSELGGWNEMFWLYGEDVDLCQRASNRGGTIALLQTISVIHNHGGSSRINPTTAALTKTEVFISRHIFISAHFTGINKILLHSFVLTKSLIKTSLIALLSLLVFWHPKAKLSRLLFIKLTRHYIRCLFNGSWNSPRAKPNDTI